MKYHVIQHRTYYNGPRLYDIVCYQDHMALYNEHVERWQVLQDAVNELRTLFPDVNPQKTLQGAFTHLRVLVGKIHSSKIAELTPLLSPVD